VQLAAVDICPRGDRHDEVGCLRVAIRLGLRPSRAARRRRTHTTSWKVKAPPVENATGKLGKWWCGACRTRGRNECAVVWHSPIVCCDPKCEGQNSPWAAAGLPVAHLQPMQPKKLGPAHRACPALLVAGGCLPRKPPVELTSNAEGICGLAGRAPSTAVPNHGRAGGHRRAVCTRAKIHAVSACTS
jgi:hypothetical protein